MGFFANQSEFAFSLATSENPRTVGIEICERSRLFFLQQAKNVLVRTSTNRNFREELVSI